MSVVNNKITVKTEGGVTYGVSIADLRTAFGSSRIDLLAIICEDARRGAPITGADMADGITNGTDTLYSAFALSDIYVNSQGVYQRGTDAIPIPSGWSFIQLRPLSFPSGRSYEKGDLIQGRYPRWHLWADGINVGKVIENVSGHYYFRYNIFKNPWTDGGLLPSRTDAPDLWPAGYSIPSGHKSSGHIPDAFAFQGYMTKVTHEPISEIVTDVELEWHNGMPAICTLEEGGTFLRCCWRGGYNILANDDLNMFEEAGSQIIGDAKMALGNIVDWWRKKAYVTSIRDNTLYGMMMNVRYLPKNHGEQTTPLTIAACYKVQRTLQEQLGYDTSNKSDYMDGYEQSITEQLGILRTTAWNDMMYGGRPEEGEHRSLDVTSELIALRNPLEAMPTDGSGLPVPRDIDKVYLTDVISNAANGNMRAVIDRKYHESSSRYRFIIMNEVERDIPVVTESSITPPTYYYDMPKVTGMVSGVQTSLYIYPFCGKFELSTYWQDNPSDKAKISFQFGFIPFNQASQSKGLSGDIVSTLRNDEKDLAKEFVPGYGYLRKAHFFALWDVACCDNTGHVAGRYKGIKRIQHLYYEKNADINDMTIQTDQYGKVKTPFARPILANNYPWPKDNSATPSHAVDEIIYTTGIDWSDIFVGSQEYDYIPRDTTAKVKIVSDINIPAFLASPQRFSKIADMFYIQAHFPDHADAPWRWYLQDYDGTFSVGSDGLYSQNLYFQLWEIQNGEPYLPWQAASDSLPAEFTMILTQGTSQYFCTFNNMGIHTGDPAGTKVELSRATRPAISPKTGIASPSENKIIRVRLVLPLTAVHGEYTLSIDQSDD